MDIEKLEQANELSDKIKCTKDYLVRLNNFAEDLKQDNVTISMETIATVWKNLYVDRLIGDRELLEINNILVVSVEREHRRALADFEAL